MKSSWFLDQLVEGRKIRRSQQAAIWFWKVLQWPGFLLDSEAELWGRSLMREKVKVHLQQKHEPGWGFTANGRNPETFQPLASPPDDFTAGKNTWNKRPELCCSADQRLTHFINLSVGETLAAFSPAQVDLINKINWLLTSENPVKWFSMSGNSSFRSH